jgi:hypothetical protein
MEQILVTIQGERFSPDVGLIKKLLADNPTWGRSRLSVKLCELWDWHAPNGQLRDMACRNLLLRLDRTGHILLPARQRKSPNGHPNRSPLRVPHRTEPIEGASQDLRPLQITRVVNGREQDRLFRCLLSTYHYLGFTHTAGENMKYLVYSRDGRPLACLLFAAAAWKCARDDGIGWRAPVREPNLQTVANNARFLLLPWVKVPNLASHLLSRITRRIQDDWLAKYAHPLYCLETFVDRSRYRGVCYRAANWQRVGQSAGRGRNDRHHRLSVPASAGNRAMTAIPGPRIRPRPSIRCTSTNPPAARAVTARLSCSSKISRRV